MILSPAPLPWRVAMLGARFLVVDRDNRVVEEVQPEIDRIRTQRGPGAARETAIERVNEANIRAPAETMRRER